MSDQKSQKVVILMSTYNGEKYIEAQLESIFCQTYENIEISVRDDGSTDKTVEILRAYEKQGKLTLTVGDNLGYKKSFYMLLKDAPKADYYSFADQDDIWADNKIEKAVNALNSMETASKKALLYFCEFDYYDADMKFISHKKPVKRELDFRFALVNYVNYGFTTVINNELRSLYLQMSPDVEFSHDYLALLLALSFGNVYHDKSANAKYRRHNANISPTVHTFIKFQVWKMKNFLFSDKHNFKSVWQKFADVYGDRLSDSEKKILSFYADEKYKITIALRKALSLKSYRESILDEIAIRFLFLIGRL